MDKSESKRFGAEGGKKRAANMTKAARSEAGRLAADARWGKDLPVAEFPGVLEIGDLKFPCAVLSDGTRVLTEMEFMKQMEMYRSGALSVRRDRRAREPLYLAFKNLKPFVDKHLNDVHTQSLPFRTLTGNIAHGIRAEIIVHVCNVWLDARDAGVLGPRQILVAEKAQLLKNALAKLGIRELVDQATGFKETNDQREIARFLRNYVNTDLRQWMPLFPRSFFEQICRLKGIPFPKDDMRMPQYIGHIVNDLVYTRIAPGVLAELRTQNPVIGPKGRRRGKFHQYATETVGVRKVINLVGRLEGMAYNFGFGEYDDYKRFVDRMIPSYGSATLASAADIKANAEHAHPEVNAPSAEPAT
jgi:hypothetical protein